MGTNLEHCISQEQGLAERVYAAVTQFQSDLNQLSRLARTNAVGDYIDYILDGIDMPKPTVEEIEAEIERRIEGERIDYLVGRRRDLARGL